MAMIHEHPAPFDGNRQSFIRHVIQVGRQQPPTRPAICGVIQGAHQVTGERFALAVHAPITSAAPSGRVGWLTFQTGHPGKSPLGPFFCPWIRISPRLVGG